MTTVLGAVGWAGGAAEAALILEPVVEGLSNPVFVTHAGDGSGRLFIVEQPGRIKVLQPGATIPTDFLAIASKVLFGGERGLLGLAFHPGYPTNRRFFVNYTRQPDGATVIAEFTASVTDPDVASPTERVLLTIPQPYPNHNGGMLAFGPDGFLYIGMGDGGSANDPENRAQNVNELLGKILRINVDVPAGSLPYSSPPDNPFFGPTPGRDEIYALGLRNPWRFAFDRLTGQLHAGDVGQGAREEVNLIARGGNYGWRVFEGTLCTGLDPARCGDPGFTAPILEYAHTGGRCSITGGYVYRGSRGALGAGTYVFGDFCSGEIFGLDESGVRVLATTPENIASFGEDEPGEMYLAGLGGTVFRLVDSRGVPAGQTFACGIGFTRMTVGISGTGRVARLESPAGVEHVVEPARSGYQVCYVVPGVGALTAFDFGTASGGFGAATRTQPNGPGTFPLEISRETADGRVRVTRRFTGNSFVGPGSGPTFDPDGNGQGCDRLEACGNCSNRTLHVVTTVENLTPAAMSGVAVVEVADIDVGGSGANDRFSRTADSIVAHDAAATSQGVLLQALVAPASVAVGAAGAYAAPASCAPTSLPTPTGAGNFEAIVVQPFGDLAGGATTGTALRLHYRRW